MRLIASAALIVAVASGLTTGRSIAQDYPTRSVTIVVPFAPGGGVDQMARLVATRLEQRWGKTFVIENKRGAGSIIAATAVQKAQPDGYTLLMAPAPTMAINVSLYKTLPYKPLDDFTPLALLSGTPFVLLVNPSVPAKSVTEFIAYAKANPGKLSFASAGPGVPHHLFMELFKSMTGLQMSHVPYRGSLPGLNDLVAGHIPVMFCDIGPSAGMIQAGKVRALGISSRARHPSFPEIPPIAEVGLPEFDVTSWQMIAAPAATPRAVAAKLNAELKNILAMPDVQQQILRYGFLPLESRSLDELRDFVKSETVRWGKVVQDAGMAGSQ
jgi:tripartite-type tricarboxylate transporter receptor subunit TctC